MHPIISYIIVAILAIPSKVLATIIAGGIKNAVNPTKGKQRFKMKHFEGCNA